MDWLWIKFFFFTKIVSRLFKANQKNVEVILISDSIIGRKRIKGNIIRGDIIGGSISGG